jgi:hypothetical protein
MLDSLNRWLNTRSRKNYSSPACRSERGPAAARLKPDLQGADSDFGRQTSSQVILGRPSDQVLKSERTANQDLKAMYNLDFKS